MQINALIRDTSLLREIIMSEKNCRIILLNGPSSSGKSSLSRALKSLLEQKHLSFSIVSIDDFMKIGTNEKIYEDDVFEISSDICDKAIEYLNNGDDVIIDHVITSERIYKQLLNRTSDYEMLKVHIACPLKELLNPFEVADKAAEAAKTTVNVPVGAFCFVLMGLCTSVMWSVIFNLSTEGVGKYTEQASGLFMTMVVGGGVLPLLSTWIGSHAGFLVSFVVPAACLAYLFVYALAFTKNVNPEIKID